MNPETPITNALWERLSLQGWTRGLLPVSPIMDSHEQLERALAAERKPADEIYKASVGLAAMLEDKLAAERALADRLAAQLSEIIEESKDNLDLCCTREDHEALAAWKEARR